MPKFATGEPYNDRQACRAVPAMMKVPKSPQSQQLLHLLAGWAAEDAENGMLSRVTATGMCRIQLLEELCAQVEPGRRAELLQQLAGGQARRTEEFEAGNFFAAKPPEFNPGEAQSLSSVITMTSP